jgi:hypothetical protein
MTTVEDFTSGLGDAYSRARAWLDERKERKAEARLRRLRERGHDSRFWLLSIPATATLCAAFVEVYWAVLFCIQATGRLDNDWAVSFGTAQAASGAWHFTFDIRSVPVLIGLVAATVPIVMWSMVWLPVQMKARGTGRWRRTTMICAGLLANALVIVSGTVVMNSNRQEQVRAGQVVEQQAGQNRSAIQGRIDSLTADLNTAMNNHNPYLAQAASVGALSGARAWHDGYVVPAQREHAPNELQIEHAEGAAAAAAALVARRDALRAQLAAAPTQAAVAAHVTDNAGVGLDTFATYANVYRPPFVALICTIIGIFGTWWWVGLAEAMNSHNVSLSGWAPEDHRIEDLRDEASVVAQPMDRQRTELRDHDSGEVIIDKDGDLASRVKEHTRKKRGKDGKPIKLMVSPDIPSDEQGVPEGLDHGDGGLRSVALHGEHEPLGAPQVDEAIPVDTPPASLAMEERVPPADQAAEEEPPTPTHPEPPISDEDEAAALLAASEDTSEEQQPQPNAEDDDHSAANDDRNEHVSEGHDDGLAAVFARANGRTPITDESRLLEAAEQ